MHIGGFADASNPSNPQRASGLFSFDDTYISGREATDVSFGSQTDHHDYDSGLTLTAVQAGCEPERQPSNTTAGIFRTDDEDPTGDVHSYSGSITLTIINLRMVPKFI